MHVCWVVIGLPPVSSGSRVCVFRVLYWVCAAMLRGVCFLGRVVFCVRAHAAMRVCVLCCEGVSFARFGCSAVLGVLLLLFVDAIRNELDSPDVHVVPLCFLSGLASAQLHASSCGGMCLACVVCCTYALRAMCVAFMSAACVAFVVALDGVRCVVCRCVVGRARCSCCARISFALGDGPYSEHGVTVLWDSIVCKLPVRISIRVIVVRVCCLRLRGVFCGWSCLF